MLDVFTIESARKDFDEPESDLHKAFKIELQNSCCPTHYDKKTARIEKPEHDCFPSTSTNPREEAQNVMSSMTEFDFQSAQSSV